MSVGVSMKKSRPWTNKEWLHHEYHTLGKSQKEIACENDTTTSTICRWMRAHGIEIRPVSQTLSVIKKEFWSNEENKAKYLRGSNNPAKRPDVREKLSEIVKGHWENNDTRKQQMSDWSKSAWTDERREEQRARIREANALNWSDESYREKMSDISKRMWTDPAYSVSAAKIAQALRGVWESEDFRERTSERAREASRKRLESIGVAFPSYNPSSIPIIESFAAGLGESVHHAENGGEIRVANYWLDGYIPNKKIAIEYDEPHHFKKDGSLSEKDVKRMKRIYKELKCSFVRIRYDGVVTVYDEQWFLNHRGKDGSIE